MRISTSMRASLANERGISLIATALWIMCFFGLTAVGIDVARIAFTASEVQSAADLAALAGARAIVDGTNHQTAADTMLGSGGGTSPNTINGQSAYAGSSTHLVEKGVVTNAGVFTVDNTVAANAARATVVATVDNLFTGIFGGSNGSTTITKQAVAGLATVGSGRPDIPLALSGGCFDNFNCTAGNCPTLSTFANNAGWTGLTLGHDASTVGSLIPAPCGDGAIPPVVNVGDVIDTGNGTQNVNFGKLRCLVCDHNVTEFTVAVVDKPCGTGFTSDYTVKGFATVVINTVQYCSAGWDQKNVPMLAVRRAGSAGGVGGCANCGTGQIRIVG